jgi:hypothetical protein
MKFLFTLLYLVLAGVEVKLVNKVQGLQMGRIQGTQRGVTGSFLFGVGLVFISFAEFWALTRIFPFTLVLILIAVSVLGLLIYFVTGSIASFTLPEKQQKIGALSVIWGASQPWPVLVALILMFLARVVAIIGALWVFWTHPVGDPRAVVLIALFHFVLVQAVGIPGLIVMSWPMVTSEYLDDDVRNSYLAQQFSQVIYGTIYLLFPLWLFKQDIQVAFPHFPLPSTDLPHFWILLSIPLLLFLAGGILPFFVGIQRYRSQARTMFDWLEEWLKKVLTTNTLPLGELRTHQLEDELEELKEEITRRFSQNQLFHFYQNLTMSQTPDLDKPLLPPAPEAVQALPSAPDGAAVAAAPAPDSLEPARFINPARSARAYLKGRAIGVSGAGTLQEQVIVIVRNNQEHLVDWDIRFFYLQRLLDLYESVPQGATQDIKAFLDSSLQNIEQRASSLTVKRNILAGGILSGASAVAVWLFKNFQDDILRYIRHLVT